MSDYNLGCTDKVMVDAGARGDVLSPISTWEELAMMQLCLQRDGDTPLMSSALSAAFNITSYKKAPVLRLAELVTFALTLLSPTHIPHCCPCIPMRAAHAARSSSALPVLVR